MPGMGDLVNKKKDRCIAIILAVKERDCDKFLPPESQYRLRKVILDQLNELSSFAQDLMESVEDGAVFNQLYMERLNERMEKLDALYDVLVDNV